MTDAQEQPKPVCNHKPNCSRPAIGTLNDTGKLICQKHYHIYRVRHKKPMQVYRCRPAKLMSRKDGHLYVILNLKWTQDHMLQKGSTVWVKRTYDDIRILLKKPKADL